MAEREMLMPQMGESVFEATVLGWLKEVGDYVEMDDSLVEVATDKVDTEIASNVEGTLTKMLVAKGDVAKIGEPIAIFEVSDELSENEESTKSEASEVTKVESSVEKSEKSDVSVEEGNSTLDFNKIDNRFYSPLVKNIAKEENLSAEELKNIKGTGRDNRVTKDDLFAFLARRSSASQTIKQIPNRENEVIEMSRMRKIIADRMIESKRLSAHVTSFVEADLTKLVKWRNKVKADFKSVHGQNLTFTPIFFEAVAKAIKDFPMINVSVDGDNIIKKNNINIGMAVALPDGNLIVPVVKHADELTLTELTYKVNDLAKRGREGKLVPDDLSGGTYTVSNIGSFGNTSGTPIIVQPQVGILALGAIIKKPAVIETAEGDMIAIRHQMILSHTYDHRVVDGALGGMFVKRVADYLENFDTERLV